MNAGLVWQFWYQHKADFGSFPSCSYQLYFIGEKAAVELTLYAKTFLLVIHCYLANRLVNSKARQVAAAAGTSKPSWVLENVLRDRVLKSKDVLESAEINDPVCLHLLDSNWKLEDAAVELNV